MRQVRAVRLAPYLFAAMWALCLIGAAFSLGLIGPRLNDARLRDIGDAVDDFSYPAGLKKVRLASGSIGLAGSGGDTTLYFGDSNIEQYWPRLQRLLSGEGAGKSVILLRPAAARPLPAFGRIVSPAARNLPTMRDLAISARVSRFVIGADWKSYFDDPSFYFPGDSGGRIAPGAPTVQRSLDNLRAMIADLRDHGIEVWIVSNIPTGPALAPLNGLKRSWSGAVEFAPGGIDRAQFDLGWAPIRDGLKDLAASAGAGFVDLMSSLCDQSLCTATTPDGAQIYRDTDHLRSSWVRDHASFIDATLLGRSPQAVLGGSPQVDRH